jgi:hypothetical protein
VNGVVAAQEGTDATLTAVGSSIEDDLKLRAGRRASVVIAAQAVHELAVVWRLGRIAGAVEFVTREEAARVVEAVAAKPRRRADGTVEPKDGDVVVEVLVLRPAAPHEDLLGTSTADGASRIP